MSALGRLRLPVLLLAALCAVLGCEEEAASPSTEVVPKVTTIEVLQQETTDYDEYTGRTEASESVDIRLPQVHRLRGGRLR